MSQNYIGVYASKEKAPAIGGFPSSLNTRKRLWFVWKTGDGNYKAQPLNAVHQPMSNPRLFMEKEFSARFTYQADCFYAPEGYTHPDKGMEALSASLQDLLMGGQGESASTSSKTPGVLRANDPDLILAWAKAEPKVKPKTADPVKIPFDQLVSEVAPYEGGNTSSTQVRHESDQSSTPKSNEETQQVRQLRSRFVQALLLLRRGARAESLAILEEMLSQNYEPFDGGSQIFSEFGLGLRRLGFIHLALVAHKRALDFAPHERILFNIARSYHDLGFMPEAKDYLEKALAVNPDFAAARNFLIFININEPEKTEI